jgi:hypothetical protein
LGLGALTCAWGPDQDDVHTLPQRASE